MDSFIFYGDYAKQIQADNLLQVIGNDLTILDSIQLAAVEECVSYLKQHRPPSTERLLSGHQEICLQF